MKVKVCDAIMGAGKTSAAINMMNRNPGRRYMFITPYLNEIDRIQAACPDLCFCEPMMAGGRTKGQHLDELLSRGYNVASTHALFSRCRMETLELIRAGGYTLILDEVMNVIEPVGVQGGDARALFSKGFLAMDDDGLHVKWMADDYEGAAFQDIMHKAQMGNLIFFENSFLFWSFPVRCFEAFEDVVILTYLFKAQVQCYYYELNGIEVEYIGTRKCDDGYEFCETLEIPAYTKDLINKVHIIDDEKLNDIGRHAGRTHKPTTVLRDTTLSASWYKDHPPLGDDEVKARAKAAAESGRKRKKSGPRKDADLVARNMINIFKNQWKCRTSDVIWTVFKNQYSLFSKRGFKHSFVSCTVRATNMYQDRHYLAYCINVFYDVRLTRYFQCRGVDIDQDMYALSEMVQWIWRSAIRKGDDIWIYVPSIRMRTLLTTWLVELAKDTKEEQ